MVGHSSMTLTPECPTAAIELLSTTSDNACFVFDSLLCQEGQVLAQTATTDKGCGTRTAVPGVDAADARALFPLLVATVAGSLLRLLSGTGIMSALSGAACDSEQGSRP